MQEMDPKVVYNIPPLNQYFSAGIWRSPAGPGL